MSERSIVISHREAPELFSWLRSALDGLGTLREVLLASELEAILYEQTPPALVVASTGLSVPSAISAIVAARAAGVTVPFVIVAGFKDDRVRAFLSAPGPRGFHHRVLSRSELATVAAELMASRSPSTRSNEQRNA
jgi:hypothetical protein